MNYLLQRNESVPVRDRNLQILMTEMFKVYNNRTSPILPEIFNKRNLNFRLCHMVHISAPHVRNIYNGAESLLSLSPKIWDSVPTNLKEVTLSVFK